MATASINQIRCAATIQSSYNTRIQTCFCYILGQNHKQDMRSKSENRTISITQLSMSSRGRLSITWSRSATTRRKAAQFSSAVPRGCITASTIRLPSKDRRKSGWRSFAVCGTNCASCSYHDLRNNGRTPSPRGGIGDYDRDRLCPTSNITKRSQYAPNKLGSNK